MHTYNKNKNTDNKKIVVAKVVDFPDFGGMSDWNKIFSSVICRPRPITYPIIKEILILDLVVLNFNTSSFSFLFFFLTSYMRGNILKYFTFASTGGKTFFSFSMKCLEKHIHGLCSKSAQVLLQFFQHFLRKYKLHFRLTKVKAL